MRVLYGQDSTMKGRVTEYTDYDLGQGHKRLSLKSHMVNISGFAHQAVSVTQLNSAIVVRKQP